MVVFLKSAFKFPLAVIVAVATFRFDVGAWRYGLPLGAIGCLIAGFYALLYFEFLPKSIEPCGADRPAPMRTWQSSVRSPFHCCLWAASLSS